MLRSWSKGTSYYSSNALRAENRIVLFRINLICLYLKSDSFSDFLIYKFNKLLIKIII